MGHASALMHFLHCAARIRNAERVRLRVHEANAAAIALYRSVGYVFEPALDQDGLRVAYKSLHP
jgi:ribosomal protein S18 acetylase RimI-like enzyme